MKPLTRYALESYVQGRHERHEITPDPDGQWYAKDEADARIAALEAERDYFKAVADGRVEEFAALVAERDATRADAERLDYIERTFSGMTNRERYLPVTMGWGKPCMGRTLREACDKHMKRDAAIDAARRTE